MHHTFSDFHLFTSWRSFVIRGTAERSGSYQAWGNSNGCYKYMIFSHRVLGSWLLSYRQPPITPWYSCSNHCSLTTPTSSVRPKVKSLITRATGASRQLKVVPCCVGTKTLWQQCTVWYGVAGLAAGLAAGVSP